MLLLVKGGIGLESARDCSNRKMVAMGLGLGYVSVPWMLPVVC